MGDIKGAIEDYDTCLRLDPAIHEALVCRGNAHNRLSQFERAISDLDAAIRWHPDWPIALSNRGNARLGLGQLAEAIDDYDAALALRRDAKTLANRAAASMALSNFDEAENNLCEAIQREPVAVMFINRGLVRQELGRLVDALADFDQGISLGPVRPGYFRARAGLKREMDDQAGADVDESSAKLLGPDERVRGRSGAYFVDESELQHRD